MVLPTSAGRPTRQAYRGQRPASQANQRSRDAPTRYLRQAENLDFGRVAFFTDAVFAIAMTLLVVEVGVPEPVAAAKEDPGALLDLLSDKVPLLIAFFVGCYVIGSYSADHHRFFSRLGAVDRSFIALTVVYLAFVALLPFPTGVLGEFGDNPGVRWSPSRST
jgi:uncharacterized membrane protein